jgi:hypothetical protein
LESGEAAVAWKRNVLVVANVTANSEELFASLSERATRAPSAFMLVVPATPFGGGREAAQEQLAGALGRLRDAGLEADGHVGAPDPLVAVTDIWDPKRYDEIIVSTLPMNLSKWLHAGLPERIAKLTDAPITHVVSRPPKPEHATRPVRPQSEPGRLGPLSVLAWGTKGRA